jgi:histidyl-tRNA synthetase
MELRAIRGTRDILPAESAVHRHIERVCRKHAERLGFREIILPVFEDRALYARSVGETSDIVEKQMFELQDSRERPFVLRPEGTASMVRAFVMNGLQEREPLKRFYYSGPMYRHERPQKGRYREFFQFGLEMFNEPAPASDILLVKLVADILRTLGAPVDIMLNSVGCPACRPAYTETLRAHLSSAAHELCEDCRRRLDRNPLRVLDCKVDAAKGAAFPRITDSLCERCRDDYRTTVQQLRRTGVAVVEDPLLVRGLDYYTGVVFECRASALDAAQNTVCAGGRYDGLVREFGGGDVPACGCAFGVDRLCSLVAESSDTITRVGIAMVDDRYLPGALDIAFALDGVRVIGPFSGRSLKAQMRVFNNAGCRYVIIVGEEVRGGNAVLKDLSDGGQRVVPVAGLREAFRG